MIQFERPGSSKSRAPASDWHPLLDRLTTTMARDANRGWDDFGRLVDVLIELDATGDDSLAWAALGALGDNPRVVARLDEYSRRVLWDRTSAIARLALRLDRGGPLVVALASTHRDGRVRERAVTAMLARPAAELTPFLVLRAGDWVRQVRNLARPGLAVLLVDDPARYLPAALPMALATRARSRAGFATTQVTAALLSAPDRVRRKLAAVSDSAQRRLLFDIGLAQGWLGPDDLVTTAESDGDVRIRVRAAEAACRDAVWRCQVPTLRRLASGGRPEVRVIALTGLLRLGYHAEVAAHLADDAPLVRATAREAARRIGADPVVWYRAAVTGAAPTPGAAPDDAPTGGVGLSHPSPDISPGIVAGFAETASTADTSVLYALLTSPDARIRAAAVRGLRLVDPVDAGLMIPLLRDPSPAVVREATIALWQFDWKVPPGLPWELLADQRVELRRAGYRLLATKPVPVRLRAGLILAVDPDPGLAGRGRADVTGLARSVAALSRHRFPTDEPLLTAAQRDQLRELLGPAAPVLGDRVSGLLIAWLATAVPQHPDR